MSREQQKKNTKKKFNPSLDPYALSQTFSFNGFVGLMLFSRWLYSIHKSVLHVKRLRYNMKLYNHSSYLLTNTTCVWLIGHTVARLALFCTFSIVWTSSRSKCSQFCFSEWFLFLADTKLHHREILSSFLVIWVFGVFNDPTGGSLQHNTLWCS